jgi:hypothetical protein
MRRSKSGILNKLEEDPKEVTEEEIDVIISVMNKHDIPISKDNKISSILNHIDNIRNIVMIETCKYFEYIKDVCVR